LRSRSIKKILVTGGAGFLGSHLCEALLNQGHQVICLDNLLTGKRKNIEALQQNPQFTFLEHDICDPIDLEMDEIYNLACPASPQHYQKDPVFTTRTCVLGSFHLLELARKNRAKILQASTSEVYGDPLVHPQSEEYLGNVNPIGPRACYDEGKRCAETLFFDFKRMYNGEIKIARIFNTYGPRMQEEDGRVVSNFVIQALRGEPITIHGRGQQTRSFCYVSDLIEGLISLMESFCTGPMNLGNPNELTVQTLAEMILEMTESQSELVYHRLPEDDPKIRCPDITRAQKELQWNPTIPIEEGLQKTIEYFSELALL